MQRAALSIQPEFSKLSCILLAVSVSTLYTSCLATEISSEEILVFQFACEIHLNKIFLKFASFACTIHGIMFDK